MHVTSVDEPPLLPSMPMTAAPSTEGPPWTAPTVPRRRIHCCRGRRWWQRVARLPRRPRQWLSSRARHSSDAPAVVPSAAAVERRGATAVASARRPPRSLQRQYDGPGRRVWRSTGSPALKRTVLLLPTSQPPGVSREGDEPPPSGTGVTASTPPVGRTARTGTPPLPASRQLRHSGAEPCSGASFLYRTGLTRVHPSSRAGAAGGNMVRVSARPSGRVSDSMASQKHGASANGRRTNSDAANEKPWSDTFFPDL